MTKQQQCNFVVELLADISSNIVNSILTNKIPSSWDGIELRELIYEKAMASRAIHLMPSGKSGQRYKDYAEVIRTRNL